MSILILLDIIKEFPLISSWFISLSKTTHFSDAVWKASDDLGYSTYLNFLMGKGRSSVMMASLFPLKLSASSQQRNVVKNERNVSAKISLTVSLWSDVGQLLPLTPHTIQILGFPNVTCSHNTDIGVPNVTCSHNTDIGVPNVTCSHNTDIGVPNFDNIECLIVVRGWSLSALMIWTKTPPTNY